MIQPKPKSKAGWRVVELPTWAVARLRGVTSHAFRRTVAMLMDRAGLSPRAAADQLGHANVSMTTDVYFGRRLASTGAAAVLEAMDQPNERYG